MATITLYSGKINQMSSLINKAKTSVKSYKSDLKSLKSKVLSIDESICDVDDVISSIKSSTKTQEDKIETLENLKQDINDFISDVVRIDGDAADAINKSQDDFYDKYEYLKPECEKSGWEKFKDGCKKVGEWCQEHWKEILAVVVVITGIVLCFVPGLNWLGSGILMGALKGALSGGLIGGLSSWASGGSFWEGFKDGVVTGAIFGGVFGGLGAAGEFLGNAKAVSLLANGKWLGKSCSFAKTVGTVAKASGAITFVMGGFDTLALGSKILFGDNWFSDFNAALHESSIYNVAQTTIASVAVFTGGMNSGFNKAANSAGVKPSCFVAGTLVMAVAGMVAIETIKSGDKVISTDPETMETSPKTVLETYIREVTTLVHLTVNGEEIVTTVDHPFYVKNQGFIKAGELIVGDELLDVNGNVLLVENFAVELTDEPTTVYNFQVEDFHTYYVGKNGILVHNADYSTVVTPDMENKILEGERVGSSNRIKGGHSPQINDANPKYSVEVQQTFPDGTKKIKFITEFPDGNVSKIKTSTIFPDNWSDAKIIDSIKQVGDGVPIGKRIADNSYLYRDIIDGVQIEVIKQGNNVIAGYPTGGGTTGLPTGFTSK